MDGCRLTVLVIKSSYVALTLSEIKELIAYGEQLGLQQMQAEGVAVVYGQRREEYRPNSSQESSDDTASILAHYSAIGREKLRGHSER